MNRANSKIDSKTDSRTPAQSTNTHPYTEAQVCPICSEPAQADTPVSPFCSSRCKTIDLGKWISGDYKISRPVEEADLDQDD